MDYGENEGSVATQYRPFLQPFFGSGWTVAYVSSTILRTGRLKTPSMPCNPQVVCLLTTGAGQCGFGITHAVLKPDAEVLRPPPSIELPRPRLSTSPATDDRMPPWMVPTPAPQARAHAPTASPARQLTSISQRIPAVERGALPTSRGPAGAGRPAIHARRIRQLPVQGRSTTRSKEIANDRRRTDQLAEMASDFIFDPRDEGTLIT